VASSSKSGVEEKSRKGSLFNHAKAKLHFHSSLLAFNGAENRAWGKEF
jgi:hypothetical protein